MAADEDFFGAAVEDVLHATESTQTQLQEDLLGPKIKRLLKVTAPNDGDASADARQQRDRERLRTLGVAATSVDTLVVVRFPAGDFVDCDGYKWETKEFFMDSKQLLATGSTVFAAQLSPEGQAQTRRRLEYDSKSYPHTEFVLDLTPPIEGVESASLVARMSLSNGVRDWWQSCYISSISKCLVSGHDDVCPKHFDLFLSGCNSELTLDSPITVNKLKYPEPRKIVDYCPIRHRAAILRLLMVIRQQDLVLDSAPRTATMIVIAKYFDCIKVVKDSILTWFMSDPNQEFIQINAEDALWMGWTAELRSVTRVAFRVLVAERAMEILDSKRALSNSKRQPSMLGRKRGTVADEHETCIEHAAQRLAQRATSLYTQLKSDDVNVHLGITHWPSSNPALCRALRTYIRKLVADAMEDATGWFSGAENFNAMMDEYDRNRARYVPTENFVSTKEIFLGLSSQQCLLTCAFWRRLGEIASITTTLFEHIRCSGLETPQPLNGGVQQPPVMFDGAAFHSEFLTAILDLNGKWTSGELEINIPKTGFLVLSLSSEEFKFLPLWAGGLDDGTGAVYQTEVPDAERGFPIGPGPAFSTGETIPDDRSSTATATIFTETGTGSISLTSGRSIQPALSQQTGLDDGLVTGAAEAQTTNANPPVQEDTTGQLTPIATVDLPPFDWTDGASGYQDPDSDPDFGSDLDNDDDDNFDTAAQKRRVGDSALEDAYSIYASGDGCGDDRRDANNA